MLRWKRRLVFALLLLAGLALLRGGGQRPESTAMRAAPVIAPAQLQGQGKASADEARLETQSAGAVEAPSSLALLPESLTTETPLDDLLDAAERSADVEDRALAVVAAAACMTQHFHLAERERGEWSESLTIEFATHDQPQHRALFSTQYRAAQAELTRYCAELRRWADWDGLRDRLRVRGSLSALVRSRPQDPVRQQRHDQAVLQMLANPRKYSAGLDGWLHQEMRKRVPMVEALSRAQQYSLEDELYARLSGAPPDPRSIRSLSRCAHLRICPALLQLGAAEQQRVHAVADELERLIRQQRWSELFRSAS